MRRSINLCILNFSQFHPFDLFGPILLPFTLFLSNVRDLDTLKKSYNAIFKQKSKKILRKRKAQKKCSNCKKQTKYQKFDPFKNPLRVKFGNS